MSKLMTIFAVIMAAMFFTACDADTGPGPNTGDDITSPDTTTDAGKTDTVVPDAQDPPDEVMPDVPASPDVEPVDPCAEIRAANICRTWEAFEYNGEPEKGAIEVTCQNSTDPDHPGTCQVREQNDHVFVLMDFKFYGKHVPTTEQPFEGTADGHIMMMWIDHSEEDGDTLNLYMKKANGNESIIRSR